MSTYYVLLGPPGAGKGTQAERLAGTLGIPHVSTGDLFRAMKTQDTPLARKVQEIMAQGSLISDDITVQMVEERLSQPDCVQGAILDGFPRTLPQADAFDDMLARAFKASVTAALMFDVDEDSVVYRIMGRALSTPPDQRRADDTLEGAQKRYKVYLYETAPLIGYYYAKGLLERIDGSQPVDGVMADLLAAVEKRVGQRVS